MQIKFSVIWMHYAVGIYRKSSIYRTDNFQFVSPNPPPDPLLTQNTKKAGRTGRKKRKIFRANRVKKHKSEPKRLRFCFGTTYGPEPRGFDSLTACHHETVMLQRFQRWPWFGYRCVPSTLERPSNRSPDSTAGLRSYAIITADQKSPVQTCSKRKEAVVLLTIQKCRITI